MKLRILGCSGGIGGPSQQTTALLLDGDILIDAGTGVGGLSIDELTAIDHVFLTHSHLDHILMLPLIIDAVGDRRATPLSVYAPAEVLASLRAHVFNWAIWPDFSVIPSEEQPYLRFQALEPGESLTVEGRTLTPLPVDHVVPAVAYRVDSGAASLVFSGDTGPSTAFIEAVNAIDNLRYLLVECAFPNCELELARLSRHFCPALLAESLQQLTRPCELYITHLKPGQVELTMAEIVSELSAYRPRMLENGQVFEF